jgi:hypothetical protein
MPTTNASSAEERRAADRDRIEHAARALLSSEGWQHWVQVRSRNGLARYSFGNQLLIALQNPDATYVAGFRAFLDLGRCVRKGERGIRIHAPMPPRKKENDDEEGRQAVRFRSVAVFDVSQTDPLPDAEPVALEPPAAPITGDSHAHLLPKLEVLAGELGYSVATEHVPGSAEGHCDAKRKRITIDADLPANARVRVLVHELAHAQGIDYTTYTRERAEVIVDTATIIACGSAGLDVTGDAIPYIAGWGEDGALDAVRGFAAEIDRVARRIEEAMTA